MKLLHRFTIGKEHEAPHLNEDAAFAVRPRGIYALSDGASESYNSRRWARILVSLYGCTPRVDGEWLDVAISYYEKGMDRQNLSWSKQAAYDRGSFATLLTASVRADGLQLLSVGDSIAVIECNDVLEWTYPYQNAEEFSQRPLLLSTIKERNNGISVQDLSCFWPCNDWNGVRLYLMTDAMGAWLLTMPSQRLAALRELRTQDEFADLVLCARADGSMRLDDTSLLVIG